MAMTKAERERMECLERDVHLAKAMRWPEYRKPSPMTKADIESAKAPGGRRHGSVQMVARGWFANAYDQGRVSYGCSDGTNHDTNWDTTSTQGMGRMFGTEAEAWQVVRIEMTERFAATLARVDAELERARSEVPNGPRGGEG